KPVEPPVLLGAVKMLLEQRRAALDLARASSWWDATFDAMTDGVCLLDTDGSINRTNQAFDVLAEKQGGAASARRLEERLPNLGPLIWAAGLNVGCSPCVGLDQDVPSDG